MRKHYDFSKAVRNPHAGKFKDGYTIVVEHKDYDEIITVTKSNKPNITMNPHAISHHRTNLHKLSGYPVPTQDSHCRDYPKNP